jgi:hypothetical protein
VSLVHVSIMIFTVSVNVSVNVVVVVVRPLANFQMVVDVPKGLALVDKRFRKRDFLFVVDLSEHPSGKGSYHAQ